MYLLVVRVDLLLERERGGRQLAAVGGNGGVRRLLDLADELVARVADGAVGRGRRAGRGEADEHEDEITSHMA